MQSRHTDFVVAPFSFTAQNNNGMVTINHDNDDNDIDRKNDSKTSFGTDLIKITQLGLKKQNKTKTDVGG